MPSTLLHYIIDSGTFVAFLVLLVDYIRLRVEERRTAKTAAVAAALGGMPAKREICTDTICESHASPKCHGGLCPYHCKTRCRC